MATELRLRRGNTSATSTFVGAEGEVTVNTSNDSLHVHDGITAGGFETARADLTNVTNATFAAKALSANVGGNITGNITGASTTASYVTIGSEAGILSNSRRLQAGNGIVLSDGGSGGAASISANLSSSAPSNLGSAAAGGSSQVARADHVHQMPTASQVGAAAQTTFIVAGSGLAGTGNLSSNVTLSLNANLNNLGDVTTISPVNGDLLIYNSATSKWVNTQNYPRITTKSSGANVGTANAVSSLNFVAGPEVTVTANGATQTDITFPTIFSAAEVRDYAGAVAASGTNTGIVSTYDSVSKKVNFSANAFTLTFAGAVTGSQTVSNLGNATITTTLPQNSVGMGFHTYGSYVANVFAGNSMIVSYSGQTNANVGPNVSLDVNVSSSTFTVGARDAMRDGFTNGTQSGLTIVYNRGANKFDFTTNSFIIALSGAITGSNTVTNLSNVSITTLLSNGAVTLGTHTTGNYVSNINVSGSAISVTGGGTAGATPTITVNSASTNTPNYLVARDASGNFSANNITASLTGLASQNLPLNGGTLTGLLTLSGDPTNVLHAATKRYVDNAGANVTVGMTGDVTASGTAGSLVTTLANSGVTSGTYTGRFTIDSKGRVTSAANVTTLSGYGITDAVSATSSQTVGGNKIFSNDVTVQGNLIVQGNSTTINTTSVSTTDRTITLASGATGASTADQSGIEVAGANANFLYDYATNSWQSNKLMTPATAGTLDIGTTALPWRNAFLSGNLTVQGTINASVSGTVTAAGNIAGGSQYAIPFQATSSTTTFLNPSNTGWVLTTNGLSSAPSWINPSTLSVGSATTATTATTAGSANVAVYVTGAAQGNITSVGTLTGLTVSGTVQPSVSANALVSLGGVSNYWNTIYAVSHVVGTGGITNAGAAGTGNIGSTSVPFNTVHAVATSARYADLAEKYTTDQEYEVGTVVAVGGEAEVTASQDGDLAIGVISAAPAYLMNSESTGQAVALKGRVPVKVVGAVKKGQQLIAAENGVARAVDGSHLNTFAVALENNDETGIKLVEAVIL